MKKIIFILAILANPASSYELPVADGIICPSAVSGREGDHENVSKQKANVILSMWNGAEPKAVLVSGNVVDITDDILLACKNHVDVVAANQSLDYSQPGFVNNKTPDGSSGDGKWYPEGVRSFDAGDFPMSRSDAEAIGIEIGN